MSITLYGDPGRRDGTRPCTLKGRLAPPSTRAHAQTHAATAHAGRGRDGAIPGEARGTGTVEVRKG